MKRAILSIICCLLAMLATAQTTYVVNTTGMLNVRKMPTTDAAIIGKLSPNQLIQVYTVDGDWAVIAYNNGIGYVASKFLIKKVSNSTPDEDSEVTPINRSTSTIYTENSSSPSNMQYSSTNYNGGWKPYRDGLGAHYKWIAESGIIFNGMAAGPVLNIVNGCAIRDYLYIGFGTGVETAFNAKYEYKQVSIPMYADFRGYLRVNEKQAPFLDFGIGMHITYMDIWGYNNWVYGLYTRVGLGYRGDDFYIGMGYELCGDHDGYFKFGWEF